MEASKAMVILTLEIKASAVVRWMFAKSIAIVLITGKEKEGKNLVAK